MAPNLSSLVPAVNFSTTTIAIVSVAASLVAIAIVVKSCIFVISMVTGKVYFAGKFWDANVYHNALVEVNTAVQRRQVVDKQSRDALFNYQHSRKRRGSKSGF